MSKLKIPKRWADYPILERVLAILLMELKTRREASLPIVELAERVKADRSLVLRQLKQGFRNGLVEPIGKPRKGVAGTWRLTEKGASYFVLTEVRWAFLQDQPNYFDRHQAILKRIRDLDKPGLNRFTAELTD
jgi:DNA-binding MarR family transcriptional regulator